MKNIKNFPPIGIFSKFGSLLTTNYDMMKLQEHEIYWAWKHKGFDEEASGT